MSVEDLELVGLTDAPVAAEGRRFRSFIQPPSPEALLDRLEAAAEALHGLEDDRLVAYHGDEVVPGLAAARLGRISRVRDTLLDLCERVVGLGVHRDASHSSVAPGTFLGPAANLSGDAESAPEGTRGGATTGPAAPPAPEHAFDTATDEAPA